MRCTKEEESAFVKLNAAEFFRLSVESHHRFTAYQATLKTNKTVPQLGRMSVDLPESDI